MKVTADTNILVRAVIEDDLVQAKAAQRLLKQADEVALTTSSLCELAWVLTRLYKTPSAEISRAIRTLIGAENVMVDQLAVDAGLAMLDEGGDFADGVIAFDGRRLGGDEFVSFDKRAVWLLKKHGAQARLLA